MGWLMFLHSDYFLKNPVLFRVIDHLFYPRSNEKSPVYYRVGSSYTGALFKLLICVICNQSV